MPRPCFIFHDPVSYPVGESKRPEWCYYCWLASNNENYRKGWDGEALSPEPVQEPNLFQKLGNFTGAVIEWFASGGERVNEEEREQRLAICKACPSYTGIRCRHCGCGITDQATYFDKLGWKTSKCPEGKWK
jgi:hypothetical protein